jgi:cell division protein FtsW
MTTTTGRRSTGAKKAATRKPAAKKSTNKTSTAKKSTAKKSTAKKSTAKKSTARKPTAKKSTAKKSTSRTSTARSGSARRSTGRRAGGRSSEQVAHYRPGTRGSDRRRGSSSRRKRRSALKVTEAGERYAAFLAATFVGLTLFGLVMVLSASSVPSVHLYEQSPFFQFKRQAAWAAIGGVAFLVANRIDYRIIRRFSSPLMLLCVGLLILLLIPGVGLNRNGSTRWLGTGSFVIQPSELTKLVLIVFIADLLARRERRMDRPELTVRPVMFVVYLCSALIILQPKLGTPMILGAVALIMLFVAGAKLNNLFIWATVSIGAVVTLAMVTGYQRSRIDGWLNPWESPQGIGLQAIQSQVGIASGGYFGVGLGASRAKWGFLPFAHTDFIFAIVAEEVGLIGASALIGAFVLVAWFGFKTALAAPDRFGMLLAAGITSWLLVQAFLNIGMVLGVLPITGEALPFVSAGGSSLVTMLAAAGLLTSVARRAKA